MPPPHKEEACRTLACPLCCLPLHGYGSEEAPLWLAWHAETCIPDRVCWDREKGWRGEAQREKCELIIEVRQPL